MALCLETYGDPKGVGISYEQGTPVYAQRHSLLPYGGEYWHSTVVIRLQQVLSRTVSFLSSRSGCSHQQKRDVCLVQG